MFAVPKETQAKLDELGVSYRIIHQAPDLVRDKFTGQYLPDEKQDPRRVKCEIVAKVTGEFITFGLGMDEPSALDDAAKKLKPEDKPRTPAQILAENEAMRAKLAKYESDKPAIHNPGKETVKAKPRDN